MPVIYSFFVGNLVIRKAVSGMTIPIAREYPLVTHCPTEVLIPKYAVTLGSAVVMAVERIEEAIPDTTRHKKISVRCLPVTSFFVFSLN